MRRLVEASRVRILRLSVAGPGGLVESRPELHMELVMTTRGCSWIPLATRRLIPSWRSPHRTPRNRESLTREADRGRRCWKGRSTARDAVYATGAGVAASGAVGYCAVGQNCWSVHSRTCARPAGCDGFIFAGIRTSSSGCSCSSPAATLGCCRGR